MFTKVIQTRRRAGNFTQPQIYRRAMQIHPTPVNITLRQMLEHIQLPPFLSDNPLKLIFKRRKFFPLLRFLRCFLTVIQLFCRGELDSEAYWSTLKIV